MLSPHLRSAKLNLPLVTYNNIMRLYAQQLQRFKVRRHTKKVHFEWNLQVTE